MRFFRARGSDQGPRSRTSSGPAVMNAASIGRTHGCNPTAQHHFSLAPGGRPHMALLVDGQHHRMARRIHVEADDVFDLLGEGRVGSTLEGAHAVRLQAVLLPDALDRAQRNPGCGRDGATGPMGDEGVAQPCGRGRRRRPRPADRARPRAGRPARRPTAGPSWCGRARDRAPVGGLVGKQLAAGS
jgi:hypothetical protein